jgi:lysophospholipase L1-like esterase
MRVGSSESDRSWSARIRMVVERLGLATFGVVVALVGLEAALQIGAVAARSSDVRAADGAPAALRIVSLGDSNTYGIWVLKEHSYPLMVHELWNAAPAAPRIEVVNLGYPGNNSSHLRSRFGDVLRLYRPNVVTIMVGVNDFWTVAEAAPESVETCAEHATGPARWAYREWLWSRSRVYRLLFIAGWWPGKQPARGGVPDWAAGLRDNLRAMIECAREVGVEPVLLTYPAHVRSYDAANRNIRAAAAANGVRLVDLAAPFAERCPDDVCPLLLSDQHPSREGHAFAAAAILPTVAELVTTAPRGPR